MNWKDFWNNQVTPLHTYNNEEWYKRYAEEINLIYNALNVKKGKILESGCGNGALFPYFNFEYESYCGLDFSESLVNSFKQKYPEVNVKICDAASYKDKEKYSFIFSNGVVQYFKPIILHKYIENSIEMLDKEGVLLLANIPCSIMEYEYYLGNMRFEPNIVKLSLLKKLYIKYKVLMGKSTLGYWYQPEDFFKYNNICEIKIFGSLFHPYRFSVALKKR